MTTEKSRCSLFFHQPSLTKQSFKDECDINKIISKYEDTGVLDHVKYMDENGLHYGDFSNVGSFQEACNTVIQAQEMFAALPAEIRSRFHNDPEKFLNFAQNPENEEEMKKIGLFPSVSETNFSSSNRPKDEQSSMAKDKKINQSKVVENTNSGVG